MKQLKKGVAFLFLSFCISLCGSFQEFKIIKPIPVVTVETVVPEKHNQPYGNYRITWAVDNSAYYNNPPSTYAGYHKKRYAHLSAEDFEALFLHNSDPVDLLHHFPLYVFPEFLKYARTLECYDSYILALCHKILNDAEFRTKTANMQFFEYSFGWGYEYSQFHELITIEAHKIMTKKDIPFLIKKYGDKKEYVDRINAIERTKKNKMECFNFCNLVDKLSGNHALSKTYGTYLDCQLHKELSSIRHTIAGLKNQYKKDQHLNSLSLVVEEYTAQAKKELSPLKAFEMVDFCHLITNVLSEGMSALYDAGSAITRGAYKGAQEWATIDHWKDMVVSAFECAVMFQGLRGGSLMMMPGSTAYEYRMDVQEHLDFVGRPFCSRAITKEEKLIYSQAKKTENFLKDVSFIECLEKGSHFGTVMILDMCAIGLATRCNLSGGILLLDRLRHAMSKGFLFSKEFTTEVAGFGKIMLESSAESQAIAKGAIETQLSLFESSSGPVSGQIRKKLPISLSREELVKKLRNVDNDILDVMEKMGGHTLERHVSKTHEKLLARTVKFKVEKDATKFFNKKTAIKVTKQSIRNNAESIAEWLYDAEGPRLVINVMHKHPVGDGVFKGKHKMFYNLTGSKIVLKRDYLCPWGFKIVTAYPV